MSSDVKRKDSGNHTGAAASATTTAEQRVTSTGVASGQRQSPPPSQQQQQQQPQQQHRDAVSESEYENENKMNRKRINNRLATQRVRLYTQQKDGNWIDRLTGQLLLQPPLMYLQDEVDSKCKSMIDF